MTFSSGNRPSWNTDSKSKPNYTSQSPSTALKNSLSSSPHLTYQDNSLLRNQKSPLSSIIHIHSLLQAAKHQRNSFHSSKSVALVYQHYWKITVKHRRNKTLKTLWIIRVSNQNLSPSLRWKKAHPWSPRWKLAALAFQRWLKITGKLRRRWTLTNKFNWTRCSHSRCLNPHT